MLRSLKTLRSFPRIKDIALVLGKHGFYQVSEALQAPIRTRLRRLFKREPRHTVEQPERLRLALEELGPTFIKFGQMLSTRPDLIPERYVRELRKLQDEVQPEPFEEIRAAMEEAFEGPLYEFFSHVDEEPLAAASIAQVHRATTLEGDSVVVKVRKRGLEKVIQQDIHVLSLFAEFLGDWPDLRLFDPEGVVRLFERSIQRELNFEYERNNLERARENLGDGGRICVPRVYPSLSRMGVLTMEYLEGEKLSTLRRRPLPADEGRAIATAISIAMLKQVFEDGFFHADPHPGNFILMKDGRIGVIDFGNMGKCTPELVDNLLILLIALIKRDFPQIARWLVKRSGRQRETDGEAMALELMDTLDPHYGLGLGQIELGGLFNSLFGLMVREGISIPAPYVNVGRTFVVLEGVVRLCSPQLELVPAIQPYMSDVLRRRWSPERIFRDLRADANEIFTAIRSYPTNLAEVLSRVAAGKLRVQSSIPEIRLLEQRIEQASNRIPLAILVCGLLVSSSILLFSQTQSESSVPMILGAFGFASGLLLALRSAVKS